ncbi:hypothetical protein JOM56_010143 [Amanita muscaria]
MSVLLFSRSIPCQVILQRLVQMPEVAEPRDTCIYLYSLDNHSTPLSTLTKYFDSLLILTVVFIIMAQPDFQVLGQQLIAASEQITLIPNMHAIVGIDFLVANFQQGFAQQAQQHAAALAQQGQQHAAALAQQAQQHNAVLAQQAEQHNAALAQQAEQHNAVLAQQVEQHNAVLAALAQQAEQHNAVIQRLDILQERFDQSQQRLPMLLHNATASYNAHLIYPPVVGNVPGLPATKGALLTLTIPNCIALAEALGLPALPAFPAPTVVNRRQQILDFLGCAIRAH